MTGSRRAAIAAIVWILAITAGPVLGRVAPGVMTASRGFTLSSALCFAAMALSLDIIAGHAGLFTLGHGAVLSIGAVASGVVTARWSAPFVVGVGAAAVVGGLVSWVLAQPALRLRAMSLGAVTLGLAILVESSLFRWPWLTGGGESLVLPRPLAGGFRFAASTDYAAIAGLVAAGAWLLDRWIASHSFGRSLHAAREDERYARALGVEPGAVKLRAFAIAGAGAGVAGATYGHLLITVGPATFGYATLSLPLLALVVIGGQGHPGAIAAVAAGYAVMPNALAGLDQWSGVVGALLFLNAVTRNPEGVAGALRSIRRRRRRARPADVPDVTALVSSPTTLAYDRTLSLVGVDVAIGDVQILDSIDLEVATGSIAALIGPNGAGKSTTLDAISGFRPLTSGLIRWGSVDLSGLPPHHRRRHGIARTFQGSGLAGRLDVEETLLLATDGPERDRRSRVREVAASIGFLDRLDVPVRELSVGQQRLLEIAAVIVSDAPLLLLDEPAAGLAPPLVAELAKALAHARDDLGRTIVVVEHNVALVRAIADTVFVLDRGVVAAGGRADDVLASSTATLGTWLGVRP